MLCVPQAGSGTPTSVANTNGYVILGRACCPVRQKHAHAPNHRMRRAYDGSDASGHVGHGCAGTSMCVCRGVGVTDAMRNAGRSQHFPVAPGQHPRHCLAHVRGLPSHPDAGARTSRDRLVARGGHRDRSHQGVLNHLLGYKLMKGAFADDPVFTFNGTGSVVDKTRSLYWGISQGGILVCTTPWLCNLRRTDRVHSRAGLGGRGSVAGCVARPLWRSRSVRCSRMMLARCSPSLVMGAGGPYPLLLARSKDFDPFLYAACAVRAPPPDALTHTHAHTIFLSAALSSNSGIWAHWTALSSCR
jgi:hypothetical protein